MEGLGKERMQCFVDGGGVENLGMGCILGDGREDQIWMLCFALRWR